MCFDMLVTILHEAEHDKKEVSAIDKIEVAATDNTKRHVTTLY
jgi:hypothetical protein